MQQLNTPSSLIDVHTLPGYKSDSRLEELDQPKVVRCGGGSTTNVLAGTISAVSMVTMIGRHDHERRSSLLRSFLSSTTGVGVNA